MAVKGPVWKDTSYVVSSAASPYTYSIRLNTGNQIIINGVTQDEVITVYNGKAWVRPGEALLSMNVNRVAQNYLYSDLPDLREVTATTTYVNEYAYRDFYFCDSAGTVLNTYSFLLDYSYEDVDLTANHDMSVVINGHGTPGMLFLSTMFSASSQEVVTTLSVSAGSSFDTTHCGDYVIYFLSRSGGWSSFLIEGQVVKTDKYTRYQITHSVNNTTIDWQKQTYNNEITDTYKVNTGWLSDDEAKLFAKHVLSTNQMYLHNLRTNEVFPVVITDSNAVYKTYKNQGRKRVNYTINVEASQTKNIIG